MTPETPLRKTPFARLPIPGINSILVVASGKGGVGKSTVAVNLALSLQKQGKSVGLLDADIYGPSIPQMLGGGKKPEILPSRKIQPLTRQGLKWISMGLLVDPDQPMIWRGPMLQTALTQMLRDVDWGALDTLVIDMPPGTGDVSLTLAQKVPITGAVIVSTPQDVALIDARKCLKMFQKVQVPILGVIENMSILTCPHCSGSIEIFNHGGGATMAANLQVPFLGEIPLSLALRENLDSGTPERIDPTTEDCFHRISNKIAEHL